MSLEPVIPARRHSRGSPAANRIAILCAGPPVLLGLAAITGWLLHVPRLIQILPGQSAMMFNTAVGLIIAAVGLAGFARRSHVSTVCGALLILIGGVTLAEHVTGHSLGLDQLLFSDWHGGTAPGRMGLNTALCFVALGLAFLVERTDSPVSSYLTLPAAIAVLSVSGAAIVGYVTGLEDSYAWGGTTRMAFPSAAGLNLLGLGLLLLGWRRTSGARSTWIAVGAGASVAGISLVISLGIMSSQSRIEEAGKRRSAAEVARLTALGVDQLMRRPRTSRRTLGECLRPGVRTGHRGLPARLSGIDSRGMGDAESERVDVFRRADAGRNPA